MFARFSEWLAKGRKRRAAHDHAWSELIEPQPDGLSRFQKLAAARVREELPQVTLAPAGTNETYLTGALPGTGATLFIYSAQAEVHGGPEVFSGEFQDYDDSEELLSAFIATARRVPLV